MKEAASSGRPPLILKLDDVLDRIKWRNCIDRDIRRLTDLAVVAFALKAGTARRPGFADRVVVILRSRAASVTDGARIRCAAQK